VLLFRIWALEKLEVRGQWLEGKTKNQLQVVSCKLQVKKPSKTGFGSRKIKTNRFSLDGSPFIEKSRFPLAKKR
jgi:hypothetical protein